MKLTLKFERFFSILEMIIVIPCGVYKYVVPMYVCIDIDVEYT